MQRRLDEHPEKMRQRRETVEHPFGTIKARMGATHFLMKTLPRVATEMALHVLAYNLTRVMNIMGVQTAHGGDAGIVAEGRPPSAVAEAAQTAGIPIRRASRRKTAKLGKNDRTATAPGSQGVNASAKAFLHDQDPKRTSTTRSEPSRPNCRP